MKILKIIHNEANGTSFDDGTLAAHFQTQNIEPLMMYLLNDKVYVAIPDSLGPYTADNGRKYKLLNICCDDTATTMAQTALLAVDNSWLVAVDGSSLIR